VLSSFDAWMIAALRHKILISDGLHCLYACVIRQKGREGQEIVGEKGRK
jgi:hypothetical protein